MRKLFSKKKEDKHLQSPHHSTASSVNASDVEHDRGACAYPGHFWNTPFEQQESENKSAQFHSLNEANGFLQAVEPYLPTESFVSLSLAYKDTHEAAPPYIRLRLPKLLTHPTQESLSCVTNIAQHFTHLLLEKNDTFCSNGRTLSPLQFVILTANLDMYQAMKSSIVQSHLLLEEAKAQIKEVIPEGIHSHLENLQSDSYDFTPLSDAIVSLDYGDDSAEVVQCLKTFQDEYLKRNREDLFNPWDLLAVATAVSQSLHDKNRELYPSQYHLLCINLLTFVEQCCAPRIGISCSWSKAHSFPIAKGHYHRYKDYLKKEFAKIQNTFSEDSLIEESMRVGYTSPLAGNQACSSGLQYNSGPNLFPNPANRHSREQEQAHDDVPYNSAEACRLA